MCIPACKTYLIHNRLVLDGLGSIGKLKTKNKKRNLKLRTSEITPKSMQLTDRGFLYTFNYYK